MNLGGPRMVPGTINYVAIGDPTPLLSVLHPFGLIQSLLQGGIHFVCPSKFEFPHDFEGSAYRAAVDDYMRTRSV